MSAGSFRLFQGPNPCADAERVMLPLCLRISVLWS